MLRLQFISTLCKACQITIAQPRLQPIQGFMSQYVNRMAAFSTSPVTLASEKGQTKLFISKRSEAEEEMASIEQGKDEYEVLGLTEAGITIPTLETVNMMVDGVRYDELPIVNIFASQNNTLLKLTDHTGLKSMAESSCGLEGFKNVKKSTSIAAQAAGTALGHKTMRMGIKHVRVVLKGIGTGRLPSIKGLQMTGVKIVSISDNTSVPSNGPRPRKARRV